MRASSWLADSHLLAVSSFGGVGAEGGGMAGGRGRERRGSRIVSVSTLLSVYVSILILLDQGPILMTSFKLYYLLTSAISKFTHIEA